MIFCVLPAASLIEMRGRWSASFVSMTTLVERPVRSSTFSSMVTPSRMSPNFTTPPASVRIGMVYGSHSAIISPAFTLPPSRFFSLAPYTIGYRSRSRSRPCSGKSTIATSPLRFMTTRSPSRPSTVATLMSFTLAVVARLRAWSARRAGSRCRRCGRCAW